MLKIELMKTQNEVARRRRDAAEHAEQMKVKQCIHLPCTKGGECMI